MTLKTRPVYNIQYFGYIILHNVQYFSYIILHNIQYFSYIILHNIQYFRYIILHNVQYFRNIILHNVQYFGYIINCYKCSMFLVMVLIEVPVKTHKTSGFDFLHTQHTNPYTSIFPWLMMYSRILCLFFKTVLCTWGRSSTQKDNHFSKERGSSDRSLLIT